MKGFLSLSILMLGLSAFSVHGSEHNLPGFVTEIEDGRLWVFKESSPEYEAFKQQGEPIKQFVSVGTGPNGMTIKAADQAVLDAYHAALGQNN